MLVAQHRTFSESGPCPPRTTSTLSLAELRRQPPLVSVAEASSTLPGTKFFYDFKRTPELPISGLCIKIVCKSRPKDKVKSWDRSIFSNHRAHMLRIRNENVDQLKSCADGYSIVDTIKPS